ncbi:TetR family transcriptional regulator [Pendulispora albinea]|uniref:TetR family transcriptional regulator n=1 Tax=Pendulispora albinea TaxID=2741071 RepID=A0ABZ2M0W9_9BACT
MNSINETRQRILAAALELFAERGFTATTTAALAQRAGVAEKTLFSQFKSKERLFEETLSPAVLEMVAPEIFSSLTETISVPWERLDDFLRAVMANRVEFAKLHRSKLKLIFQELLLRPELFQRFLERGQRDLFPKFVQLAEHFERLGELRPMPKGPLLRMIISMMAGYLATRSILMPEDTWDDASEIGMMVAVLTDGLRPRVRPKAGERLATPAPSRAERIPTPPPMRAERIATPAPSRAERIPTPPPMRAERIATPAPSRADRIVTPPPSKRRR